MASKAFRACEVLYADYPAAAVPLDDRDQTMVIVAAGRRFDLVRHVFQGRKVIFRLYPAGRNVGTEIQQRGKVPAGMAELLAAALPERLR